MLLNVSKVREIISKIFVRVVKTGDMSEVRLTGEAKGIVCVEALSKLSRLAPRDYLRCDPESIVHLDWSGEAGEIE